MELAEHSAFRQQLLAIEREQLKKPQVPMSTRWYYAPGIAAKELTIPQGTEITGAIHKEATINVLSQGELLLFVPEGMVWLKAPYTVVSPAGTKRAALTLTDCVWTTFFATDLTDPEQVIDRFTTNDEQAYQEHARLALKGT
jgi:hypothetical protein